MKASSDLLSRIRALKEGESLEVILLITEPGDLTERLENIQRVGGSVLSFSKMSTDVLIRGTKEALLAVIEFPWLVQMSENQRIDLIE